MASITFNDGTSATLSNGLTAIAGGLGSRFSAWTPFQLPVGPTAVALGTGRVTRFVFRVDYGASFSMREIPNTSFATMLRLQAHMMAGGIITVTTDDAASRTYNNCAIAPESEVTIEQQDATALLYQINFRVINLSAAQMICEY